MNTRRQRLFAWAARGRIAAPDFGRALEAAEVLPTAADWRRFLDQALLWLGTVMLASGVIFFFAYNWDELHRFARFALVQGGLLACLAVMAWTGPDRPAGRAALLGACLLTGALLALIGQTYQSGADTVELFAAWAALILPWALLGRFAALWVLWLGLVNLSIALYYGTFGGFVPALGADELIWALFLVDTLALLVWEALSRVGGVRFAWLREPWALRLLATAGGGCVTLLALNAALTGALPVPGDGTAPASWPAWLAWLAWLGGAWLFYRRLTLDLYVLAGAVLSVILVLTAWLSRHLVGFSDAGGLVLGLLVIGLSAAGGRWLRTLAAEAAR